MPIDPIPADEAIHAIKSLEKIFQPPVWNTTLRAPHINNTIPYVTPDNWQFPLPGIWHLSRIILQPFLPHIVGSAPVVAAWPSMVNVVLSGRGVPFVLDANHWEIRDLRYRVTSGTRMYVENCDTVNDGMVYLEFEGIALPEYATKG